MWNSRKTDRPWLIPSYIEGYLCLSQCLCFSIKGSVWPVRWTLIQSRTNPRGSNTRFSLVLPYSKFLPPSIRSWGDMCVTSFDQRESWTVEKICSLKESDCQRRIIEKHCNNWDSVHAGKRVLLGETQRVPWNIFEFSSSYLLACFEWKVLYQHGLESQPLRSLLINLFSIILLPIIDSQQVIWSLFLDWHLATNFISYTTSYHFFFFWKTFLSRLYMLHQQDGTPPHVVCIL